MVTYALMYKTLGHRAGSELSGKGYMNGIGLTVSIWIWFLDSRYFLSLYLLVLSIGAFFPWVLFTERLETLCIMLIFPSSCMF